MEQNAIGINNVLWFLIAGIITVAITIIGFFIKKTLDRIEIAVNALTLAVQEMRLVMKGQEGINKEYEDSLAELWETSGTHTADIEDVKKRVNDLETIHNYCKNNHNKRKSDEQG